MESDRQATDRKATAVVVDLRIALPLPGDKTGSAGLMQARNVVLELEGIVNTYGGTLTIDEAKFA